MSSEYARIYRQRKNKVDYAQLSPLEREQYWENFKKLSGDEPMDAMEASNLINGDTFNTK